MQSELPFYESVEDALKAAIQVLGGSKKVGPALWPDKTIEAASRTLSDCLNPSLPSKLDITQLMMIFRVAKDAGCHAPFTWFCAEIGYDARPISKAEEVDRLTTVIAQASDNLARGLAALERMKASGQLRAVGT